MDARGRIFSGCNVENHSSPSSLCAEQAAVASAVAGGSHDLIALAIVAEGDPRVLPCGRCRQVLIEFGPSMLVLAARPDEEPEELLLADLLPRPFRR
jgi:cytidine deaminase